MKLGEIIVEYRTKHDLSLRQFAASCDVSHVYISMLEKGFNPKTGKPIVPNLDTFKSLAEAMGMTIDDLMRKVDNMEVEINPTTSEHLSKTEKEMIRKFRKLDDRGQDAVLAILEAEYRHTML